MKRNKNVWYLIKEGFCGLLLHGFMSFAAICVTVACLILTGSFYLVMLNINSVVDRLDSENQIVAYIDETYTEAEAKSVGSRINMIENVSKCEFVSKTDAFRHYISGLADPKAFENLPEDTLRHRFVITLESSAGMAATGDALREIKGVADVSANLEIADGFASVRNVISLVSTALIAILLVVSLFIISNTVRLAMYDRRDEIGIMKMVGATNSFIQIPFVIEGFLIGIISAAAAFFAEWGIYDSICTKITEVQQLFEMISFRAELPLMIGAFLIAGLFVGIIGSLVSIRRFLNV